MNVEAGQTTRVVVKSNKESVEVAREESKARSVGSKWLE